MQLTSYKAFLFDVDKTLTNSKKEITPVTKAALAKLAERGFIVGLCTGRLYATLRTTLQELFPPKALHVTAGGAQIINTHGEVQYEKTITDEVVRKISHIAEKYSCRFVSQKGEILYGNEKALAHTSQSALSGSSTVQKHPLSALSDWSFPLVVISGTTPELIKELSSLPVSYKEMVNYAGEPYVDVTAKDVNKATAIEKWCALQGISPDEVIGFGDSENDIEFLQTVGHSIAMGNAIEPLKAIADEVTLDCDHDGVAAWIEKNSA